MSTEFKFEEYLNAKLMEVDELKKTELGRQLAKKLEDFHKHFSTLSVDGKIAFDSSFGSELQKSLDNLDNSLKNGNLPGSTEIPNENFSGYSMIILIVLTFFGLVVVRIYNKSNKRNPIIKRKKVEAIKKTKIK
ncbi:unnamed protein product [Diamesa tonsa]